MWSPEVKALPATEEHLAYIAQHMREADRREVWAFGQDDPYKALKLSRDLSTHAVVIAFDGVPAIALGVSPVSLLGGVGAPWMLGTDEVTRAGRALTTHTSGYIRAMLDAYPHLVNHVHAPNTKAVRWLRRIGFTLEPAAPFGPRGELFHRFEMKA